VQRAGANAKSPSPAVKCWRKIIEARLRWRRPLYVTTDSARVFSAAKTGLSSSVSSVSSAS